MRISSFARFTRLTAKIGLSCLLLPWFSLSLAENITVTTVKLSIDDLVAIVLQHNASLKASQRSVELAGSGIITASAFPNPRLEFNSGRNVTPATSAASGIVNGIGISQFIENPTLRSARITSAQFAELGSVHALALTRNELVGEVKLRCYEYLLRREEALAAADALSLLEQTRERIKVRVDTGEAGKYELIKADAEIVSARQREETARLQIAQAAISINRLAAGMLPAHWELNAQLHEILALPSLEILQQVALRENPELRLLEAELERNKSRINEA